MNNAPAQKTKTVETNKREQDVPVLLSKTQQQEVLLSLANVALDNNATVVRILRLPRNNSTDCLHADAALARVTHFDKDKQEKQQPRPDLKEQEKNADHVNLLLQIRCECCGCKALLHTFTLPVSCELCDPKTLVQNKVTGEWEHRDGAEDGCKRDDMAEAFLEKHAFGVPYTSVDLLTKLLASPSS